KCERNEEGSENCFAPRALIANYAARRVNNKGDRAQSFLTRRIVRHDSCRSYNSEVSNQTCQRKGLRKIRLLPTVSWNLVSPPRPKRCFGSSRQALSRLIDSPKLVDPLGGFPVRAARLPPPQCRLSSQTNRLFINKSNCFHSEWHEKDENEIGQTRENAISSKE